MASTEVERRTGVDVEDVPSAEWGWSTQNLRLYRVGGVVAALFLLLMTHGNHVGHVEDWFMVGFAAVLLGFVARSWWIDRYKDKA
ncbi:DUF2631 domain-containing protein [Mycolicibacterium sp.]|uniref:DUF2631 domain-containing protein n=1 Tax=Mycolicibacterium sp. TaxID=2320850 RepID=UPI003D0CD7C7